MKSYAELSQGDIARQSRENEIRQMVLDEIRFRASMRNRAFDQQKHYDLFYSPVLNKLVVPYEPI